MGPVEPPRDWRDDDDLLADLGAAWAAVLPSAGVVADRAIGLLPWRTIEADLALAELVFDSDLHAEQRTRSAGGSGRLLVFATETTSAEPVSIELEVMADRIVGQLLPPQGGEVTVEAPDGARLQVRVDDYGGFTLPLLPAGTVRLLARTAVGRLVTGWVQL